MSISVVFILKNGIKQGYCFWESLSSCLSFADEIIISEGFSEDGTLDVLMDFRAKNIDSVPIVIYQDAWPERGYHGEPISIVSERAIAKAKSQWIYYLQADEIIHEDSVDYIKSLTLLQDYHSISFPFYHFIRSWKPSEEGYKEAIRMIRNGRDITLMGDAWNFQGAIDPIYPAGHSPKPIYHFAWCFPKQNDTKSIEHAKLYENYPEYQEQMRETLKTIDQAKEPYPLTEFNDFPKISRRFIGKPTYTLP